VAAGASQRMGGVDKLRAPLLGRPLLSWSLDAVGRARPVERVVLVTAAPDVGRLQAEPWVIERRATVVAGGRHRSDSVRAGVAATEAPIVVIHDGARPLASSRLTEAVIAAAAEHGAAVPALPVADAVKRVVPGQPLESVQRDALLRAQTPQAARRELLLAALEATAGTAFDDEAALLESQGVSVATVPGEASNLKVTEPADLELVRDIAAGRRSANERRGTGHDSHPFGPADGLLLGGVELAEAPRLYGHSDGDVVLHAVTTALLAAAGLGDVGRLYPAGRPETRDAPSSQLLAGAIEQLADAGWRPTSAQVVLIGARPRLGAEFIERMRSQLALLLGLDPAVVALSASSGNLTGAEGAGLAMSASADVTIGRP
jgi:2-C-methyl-D-erythritol 4-phosphate cytidylyltransferase / 2-C-methyl-D-erythritol 2,4-cyclodiphosphate synthase